MLLLELAPATGKRRGKSGVKPVTAPKTAEFGLILDGALAAMLRPAPAASIPLPRHKVHYEASLIGADGVALTPFPLPLAAAYAIAITDFYRDGLVFHGAFTAAPWLADDLGVEVMDGSDIAARAIAKRDNSTPSPALWRFSAPLLALPQLGREAVLRLRIAGLGCAAPSLKLSQEIAGLGGCIDSADAGHITGWAIDRRHRDFRAAIDLFDNGRLISTTQADRKREDLRDLGLPDCAHGFAVAIPPARDPAAKRLLSLRFADSKTDIHGSPILLDPQPARAGCFDRLHHSSAFGWAVDYARPGERVVVEAVTDTGEVVGTAIAGNFRGDLLRAGIADGFCAFKLDFTQHFDRLIGKTLAIRLQGAPDFLSGSPKIVAQNPNFIRLKQRRQMIPPQVLPRLKRALTYRAAGAGLSIIMPVHNPTRQFLIEALESVRGQWCDSWELICVDDGSTVPHVREILQRYAAADTRIRILASPQNLGIARATNLGLRAARYGYIALMDHDDALEPDAVWQMLAAAQDTGADLLYSDEVLTTENLNDFIEMRLRPAWSHDYYLSHPYFVHLIAVRTDLARAIGGFDETMTISADVDFVLRASEQAKSIAHVPAVLYRWRTHGQSAGHTKQDDVMAATIGALQAHLDRLKLPAIIKPGCWFNQFYAEWPDPGGPVLIIIPTKNKGDLLEKAVASIERTAAPEDVRIVVIDHESDDPDTQKILKKIAQRHHVMPYHGAFNFSRMNNLAVRQHGENCPFILFLNNDIEAIQPGWIARLRSLAARPEIGAVGPLLMYDDQKVQHGGVILGFNRSADHALKFQDVWIDQDVRRNLGYNCALSSVRDYAAVTAACLMMRREIFDRIGGFDEDFAIGFNDTDLCLRIAAAGYRILYDGSTMLYHYESATRADTKQVLHPEDTARMVARWGNKLQGGDPWYNPLLSLITQDHVPREDNAARPRNAPRVQPGPAYAKAPQSAAKPTPLKPKSPRATLAHGQASPPQTKRPNRKSA
jgi:GT2 family glycosyltransferase